MHTSILNITEKASVGALIFNENEGKKTIKHGFFYIIVKNFILELFIKSKLCLTCGLVKKGFAYNLKVFSYNTWFMIVVRPIKVINEYFKILFSNKKTKWHNKHMTGINKKIRNLPSNTGPNKYPKIKGKE